MRTPLLAILAASLLAAAAPAPAPAGDPRTPFALLELFTSEGCSSCPPAERLLGRFALEAAQQGTHVLVLEWHVDYWNSGGWTDPFSDHGYSVRQERYAHAFGLEQLYTPQLVVNGAAQCVGSDRAVAEAAARAALARPADVALGLRVAPEPDGVRVDWTLSAARAGQMLCLALVQPDAVTRVAGGENAGRTLAHTNVVRAFESLALGAGRSGTAHLRRPAAAGARGLRVIGFVQDPRTLAVLGAAGS